MNHEPINLVSYLMPDEHIIYGINAVKAALKSDTAMEKIFISNRSSKSRLQSLLQLAHQRQIPVQFIPPKALTQKAAHDHHQGIIAVLSAVRFYTLEDLLEIANDSSELPFLAMLDGIEDPHNLGAIIRTAEASGCAGIILQRRRSAPLSPVVSKTSAGAIHYLPIAKVSNLSRALDRLKEAGYWIVGSDENAQRSYWEIPDDLPLVVVIGSEGAGMRRLVQSKCDYVMKIPLYGKTESLNASVAAALLFYEVCRKRNQR